MLDKDVAPLMDNLKTAVSGRGVKFKETHFINLSRGLLAGLNDCIPEEHVDFVTSVRIPSTWCEQKMWDRILETLSPELWLAMAMDRLCVIHDVSEKQRQTRAMWQGLSWIRYSVSRGWELPVLTEYSRSGMEVSTHWEHVYRNLPNRTKNVIKYYKNYYVGNGALPVQLESCRVCDKGMKK